MKTQLIHVASVAGIVGLGDHYSRVSRLKFELNHLSGNVCVVDLPLKVSRHDLCVALLDYDSSDPSHCVSRAVFDHLCRGCRVLCFAPIGRPIDRLVPQAVVHWLAYAFRSQKLHVRPYDGDTKTVIAEVQRWLDTTESTAAS